MNFYDALSLLDKNNEVFDFPFLLNRKYLDALSFEDKDRFSLTYKISDEYIRIFSENKRSLNDFFQKAKSALQAQLLKKIVSTFDNLENEIGNFEDKLTLDTFDQASVSFESIEKYSILDLRQYYQLFNYHQRPLKQNPKFSHFESYRGSFSDVEIFTIKNSSENKKCLGVIFPWNSLSVSQLNVLPISENVNRNFGKRTVILSTDNTLMAEFSRTSKPDFPQNEWVAMDPFDNLLVFSHYTKISNSGNGIIIKSKS